jgi:hypothetical protein
MSAHSTATAERPSDLAAPRTALATVCISGTFEDKLDAAAGAGFDGVETFEPDLVASALSPAEIRGRCEGLGLTIAGTRRVVADGGGLERGEAAVGAPHPAVDDGHLLAVGQHVAVDALDGVHFDRQDDPLDPR